MSTSAQTRPGHRSPLTWSIHLYSLAHAPPAVSVEFTTTGVACGRVHPAAQCGAYSQRIPIAIVGVGLAVCVCRGEAGEEEGDEAGC